MKTLCVMAMVLLVTTAVTKKKKTFRSLCSLHVRDVLIIAWSDTEAILSCWDFYRKPVKQMTNEDSHRAIIFTKKTEIYRARDEMKL